VIFAGKKCTGRHATSAAKGTRHPSIRAVIAETFERIHGSNLVGMGVVPAVSWSGTTWQTWVSGVDETVTIRGIAQPQTTPTPLSK
jgi:aconitate hydratase